MYSLSCFQIVVLLLAWHFLHAFRGSLFSYTIPWHKKGQQILLSMNVDFYLIKIILMILQCSITRKRVKATLSVSTNPLRQTLHTSRRDLIFNYALGAISSGPTNQCAGKQASSYKIKNVLYGSSYLSNTQKQSDFQFSND